MVEISEVASELKPREILKVENFKSEYQTCVGWTLNSHLSSELSAKTWMKMAELWNSKVHTQWYASKWWGSAVLKRKLRFKEDLNGREKEITFLKKTKYTSNIGKVLNDRLNPNWHTRVRSWKKEFDRSIRESVKFSLKTEYGSYKKNKIK